MIAVIDIGNTRTKLALFDEAGKISREAALATHEDFKSLASDLFSFRVSAAVIGSVVPARNEAWQNFFSARAERVHLASHRSPWGFKIGVENPETVGIDRLANAEAALSFSGAVVMVDAGTATKVDLVEGMEKKEFVGGAIAPGLELSYRALLASTAQLPEIDLKKHSPVVGYNTETAIRSGVVHGFAALVDGLVLRTFEERKLPYATSVVATGGNMIYLPGRARLVTHQRPRLTMEGLYALARKI
jgi:type III pantothenate kinase